MINVDIIKKSCDNEEEGYFFPCSYGGIIKSFGYELITYVDIGDYQGDSLLLFKDGDKYGFLSFGWGSCSVCDALQGCENIDEVVELANQLHDSIQWHSRDKMIEYLSNKDWESEWYYDKGEAKKFGDKAVAMLREIEEP